MKTYEIHWHAGFLVIRGDEEHDRRSIPCDDPIDASTDSWEIAERCFADANSIEAVDHDRDTIMVTIKD